MGKNYHLYYEALEASQDAFDQSLFTEASLRLSTALGYAFDTRSPRKLAKVERFAQEQLKKLEEHFTPMLSPLEPEEVSNYRTLVEQAATYRALMENASHGDTQVVTSSYIEGHTFEDTTSLDPQSGEVVSSYAIDGVAVDEPSTWDLQYITAQEHEKAHNCAQG